MTKFVKLMAAAGAMSLVVTPVVASAAPANKAGALSLRNASVSQGGAVRAGTAVKKSSGIGAAIYPIIIVAIVGATLGFGISNDRDEADSR